MDFKYTFIIPHKNCPILLQRCLDSIPVRDDIQVIVVDDNSDMDKKPRITRENVEVFLLDEEQSKGAGRARNIGLEHARGKWLLFADADDYYSSYLPVLLDKYADDDSTDIVYLNACKFDENGIVKPHKTEKLIKDFLNCKKGSEMRLRYDLWTPWSRMVKRHMVVSNQIKFDELPATNDKMFCLKCSFCSKIINTETTVVYNYYRPHTHSITDKQRNYKMLDGLLDVRRRTICLYKEAGYKNIPSFWILLNKTPYVEGLTKAEIWGKYLNILRDSHTSIWIDKCRYYRSKYFSYFNI